MIARPNTRQRIRRATRPMLPLAPAYEEAMMDEMLATELRQVTCRDCSAPIRVRLALGAWGLATGLGACFCEACLRQRVEAVKAGRLRGEGNAAGRRS